MTTLRELADALFDKTGTSRSTTVGLASTVDDPGRMVTRAINDAGDAMVQRPFAWQGLLVESSAQLASNTERYTFDGLPGQIVGGGVWLDGPQEFLDGPLDATKWFALKRGGGKPGTTYAWRMIGDQIELYPTPSVGGDWLRCMIRSRLWAQSPSGTAKAYLEAEDDTIRLDRVLMELDSLWRFRRSLGLQYETEAQEAQRAIARGMGSDQPGVVTLGGIGPWGPTDPTIPMTDLLA